MAILLFSVAVNVLIAAFLEGKRKRLAVICHVMLVGTVFTILLLCGEGGGLYYACRNLLGDATYNAVLNVLCAGNTKMLLPLLIVQIFLFLQTLFIVVFAVQTIVTVFRRKQRNFILLRGDDFAEKLPFVGRWSKLFYLLQVLRC